MSEQRSGGGRRSAWRLLMPQWLALHVFVVAVCITMVWLGKWQWDVAFRRHGDIQNYAYAFQWWAFTVFAVVMWLRVMRDYIFKVPGLAPAVEQAVEVEAASEYVAYIPPQQEHDPDLDYYNRFLSATAEQQPGVGRQPVPEHSPVLGTER